MSWRVLATARSFCRDGGRWHAALREAGCALDLRARERPYAAAELAKLAPGYDGAILGLDVCDAEVLAAADRLRVISRFGIGTDNLDLDAARARGVRVFVTPGANTVAVAEHTLALIFALARSLPQVAAAARDGRWVRPTGWELTGRCLGLVGLGAIGRAVAVRAAALGMEVVAFDPYARGAPEGVTRVDFDELLRRADVVSLHCALTPETRGIVDAAALERMKPGAVLVNTARGGLVDEVALHRALTAGKLAGAACDVFVREPPVGNPLLELDAFVATPHLASTTREAVERMSEAAVANLLAGLHGRDTPDRIV